MDDAGNILVRRYCKSNVFIKSTSSSVEDSAIGSDVMKLPNQSLEIEKVYKVMTVIQIYLLPFNDTAELII